MIGTPNTMPLDEAVTVARKALAIMLGEDSTSDSPSRKDMQDAYWVIAQWHSDIAKMPSLRPIKFDESIFAVEPDGTVWRHA